MSATESAQRAARLTDPVGHSLGILGMLGGMLLGAIIGAALVVGAVATGGALVIAVASFAAIGCVAGGGLAGGQLVRGLQKALGLDDPQTGVLGPIASPTVRIGGLFAARATDTAATCSGLMGFSHFSTPLVPIAEGAKSIRINNLPAARVTSKLVCGAKITDGDSTVVFGGPTERVLEVHDFEEQLGTVLGIGVVVSMIGIVILQPEAIVPILGFMVVSEGAGDLADAIWGPDSGARDIVQGLLGLGALIFFGRRGMREEPVVKNEPPPGPKPPDPALAERAGPLQDPWMIRDGEGTRPATARDARPGEPMELDPNTATTYMYVVKEDGTITYAPQEVLPGGYETVKHTDLAENGPARVSGEIKYDPNTDTWVMDNNSGRYSNNRTPDGQFYKTRNQDNVDAAAELARQSGTKQNIVSKPQ